MRLKKISFAILVCLALAAVPAGDAQAAGAGWAIGTTENQTTAGTLIPFGSREEFTCQKHGGTLVLISNLLGQPVEISAENVDCYDAPFISFPAEIDNTTSAGHSEVFLMFTGVKVLRPSPSCKVPGGVLVSEQLTGKVIMDPAAFSTAVFDRLAPEIPGGTILTVEFEGATCPLAGVEVPLKGSACGESVHTDFFKSGFEPNATGTLTVTQTLLFGASQQTTGNSTTEPCALTFGKTPAQFAGAIDTKLAGINSGKPFGD